MSVRTERVRGHIRREIAGMLLRQEVHDPRLSGVVSITDVRLSPDLQYATVYFSVMGAVAAVVPGGEPVDHVQECQKVLTHAAGFIRGQLGRRLALRHTPSLRFLPDNSLDYGQKIAALLKSVPAPAVDDTDPAEDGITLAENDMAARLGPLPPDNSQQGVVHSDREG